jgi:hypothetical protein
MAIDVYLGPGETLDVTAVLRNRLGGAVLQRAIDSWTTDDATKATVVATGDRTARITGVASTGTTEIRAHVTSGVIVDIDSSMCTVHCTTAAGAIRSIDVSPSSFDLVAAATQDLIATFRDRDGNEVERAVDAWTTTDGSKVTVASTGDRTATATGVASSGTAAIHAEINTGLGAPLSSDDIVVTCVESPLIAATGGTITDVDGFRIHTFTASGTFHVTNGSGDIEVLIVAGGGGGGGTNTDETEGGGGGGGGVHHVPSTPVSAGSYAVVVGDGGANVAISAGTSGSDSSFDVFTATGGGGGGEPDSAQPGLAGGSGGGGGSTTFGAGESVGGAGTTDQGNAGGDGVFGNPKRGGGGGGGSAAGNIGGTVAGTNGDGGAGYTSDISGTTQTYAGGGGGGRGGAGGTGGGAAGGAGARGADGTTNTGGGGGGSSDGTSTPFPGGDGGSGVVIVRYSLTAAFTPSPITATGGTITDIDGFRVHTFTDSGTFEITAGQDTVTQLLVGGGGAGGGVDGAGVGCGGGGGGGVVPSSDVMTVGSFAVVVGAGGVGADTAPGASGGDSTFNGHTATGGGGGGGSGSNGADGGSGGGAASMTPPTTAGAGTTDQGNAGGPGAVTGKGGGGGGAGSGGKSGVGATDGLNEFGSTCGPGMIQGTVSGVLTCLDATGRCGLGTVPRQTGPGQFTCVPETQDTTGGTGTAAGIGGDGIASDISGTSTLYGGGGGGGNMELGVSGGAGGSGGGGAGSSTGAGADGAANTGGGGGGSGGAAGRAGGSGGSGVVIVRYPR